MERTILAFETDEEGEWRVRLDCGHARHLRHDPPREYRPDLSDPEARRAAIGRSIDCGRCSQRLLPDGARRYKSTPVFTEATVPKGLLKDHSLKAGVWGRLVVLRGSLKFHEAAEQWTIDSSKEWYVLPEVLHSVEMIGPVSFRIDFYATNES